jgi:hypothetical protein
MRQRYARGGRLARNSINVRVQLLSNAFFEHIDIISMSASHELSAEKPDQLYQARQRDRSHFRILDVFHGMDL